jgi:hypothetical protein
MKNNTEDLKNLLKKALLKIPSDFSLFEVKRYINLAISKIEQIEKKRKKRSIKSEERREKRNLKVDSEDSE